MDPEPLRVTVTRSAVGITVANDDALIRVDVRAQHTEGIGVPRLGDGLQQGISLHSCPMIVIARREGWRQC